MALIFMLLAALNVSPFNAPLTQEEIETKACHEYCDGVEQQLIDKGMGETWRQGQQSKSGKDYEQSPR